MHKIVLLVTLGLILSPTIEASRHGALMAHVRQQEKAASAALVPVDIADVAVRIGPAFVAYLLDLRPTNPLTRGPALAELRANIAAKGGHLVITDIEIHTLWAEFRRAASAPSARRPAGDAWLSFQAAAGVPGVVAPAGPIPAAVVNIPAGYTAP
jgi:hypothetical protein